MAMVKLSSKHQVVIPKKVRKKLGLHAGDQLVVEVEGEKVVLHPRPKNYTNYMLGLGRKVWHLFTILRALRGISVQDLFFGINLLQT